MIHVFPAFAGFAPEGRQAIEQIGEFIQKFFIEKKTSTRIS